LHPGALAHHDALLNFAKWPHEDPVTEGSFIEVARFNKGHVFAKTDVSNQSAINFHKVLFSDC